MEHNNKTLLYLKSLVEFLKSKGEIFVPLDRKTIDAIQQEYSITLPEAYIEFLATMGKGASRFMRGSSVFYPELLELKEWTEELVDENNISNLPNNSFPFWMHQGYQVAYFLLNNSPNPTVYYFSEGNDNEWKKVDSFTKFLEIQLIFSGLDGYIQP